MLSPQAPFFYQNIVAAHKILELINVGSPIKSIELDNPARAKHIDDIIIEYAGLIQYYQVKWSSDEKKPYTIHNLVTSEDESRPLIQQLARGYSELADRDNVEIILYSTRTAGINKQPSLGINHSLQDFLKDIHTPLVNSPTSNLSDLASYSEYEGTIQLLFRASGLPDEVSFCRFLKRLRFELNQDGIDAQKNSLLAKLELLGIERPLYDSLLNAVVEWSIPPRRLVFAADVLKRLGLADRFVDRVTHEFEVVRQHYVENSEVFQKLDQAITELDSGFVLLEGPPGSGKSTALTMYRRQRENVRFAYYCFIPDEIGIGDVRLERATFLKSLCLGIQNSFPNIDFPQPYSQDYDRKLNAYLDKLGQLGAKVVFIVDGLDYVDKKKREQLLRDPLTNALNGKLPRNILFILSSQYPEALSTNIQNQIGQSPLRHIQITSFSFAKIESFLRLRRLNLSSRALTLVAGKSEGIPLYLDYIANILADTPAYKYESVLEELPILKDHRIDSYHSELYEHLAKDEFVVYILAVLAHRKDYTTKEIFLDILRLMNMECNTHRLETALKRVKHLLKMSDASSYTIRHDSFRQFVLEQTRYLGNDINRALISYYEANPNADETYRHFYRHLFEVGQYERIVQDCNEDWLYRSWQAFRPFSEIDLNLDLAWQATIKLKSLKEFVRIAFLKQRLGLIMLNTQELNHFNYAQFLLGIGKPQNAIRILWDGTRVDCSPIELAEFALNYPERTGDLLPERIVESGLSEPNRGSSLGDLKTYYQARMLYATDWRDLFGVVSRYQWKQKDNHDYTVQQLPPDEVARFNDSIQVAMVNGLYHSGKYASLMEISQSDEVAQEVKNEAIVSCIQLLLAANEVEEAVRLVNIIDFGLLTREQYNRLLVCLAESHQLAAAQNRATLNYLPPSLFSNLVKDGIQPSYGIKEELFTLYENLRVHFSQNPNGFAAFMLKASTFNMPEQGFFSALIELAQLWCDTVAERIEATTQLQKVKRILNYLDIDHTLIMRTLHNHLGNDAYYIGLDVHKLYARVFAYVAKFLAPRQIIEVVGHWLLLDTGPNGYKNFLTSIEFAKLIKSEKPHGLEVPIKQLLDRAKVLAKSDRDTEPLVGNLLACAEAYGYCGFEEESIALWNELFVYACGVGSHKDYQFNQALPSLYVAHKTHPKKSLQRLARLLTLAHQVPHGAEIEALIAFSSKISSELALELLHREDKHINREEAIQGLVQAWSELPDRDLVYVWAVVKTMNKWEDFRAYNDHTYPTMSQVFEYALSRRNLALIQEIYLFARRQFLVEKEQPGHVFEFAQKCQQSGAALDMTESDIEQFKKYKEAAQDEDARHNSLPAREPPVEPPSLIELHELSIQNFDEFTRKINELRFQYIWAECKRESDHAYYELKRVFTSFHDHLSDNAKAKVKKVALSIAKRYVHFKKEVQSLLIKEPTEYKVQIGQAFDRLLSDIATYIPGTGWESYVQNSFDSERWLEGFIGRSLSDYWFERDVLARYVVGLIEKSPLSNLAKWEQFCRNWLHDYELSRALIAISKRLQTLDPACCSSLLIEAWTVTSDLFFYDRGLAVDLLRSLFEVDPSKAKEILIDSFYHKYRKHGHQIVYKLGLMVEFADQLGEENFADYLYQEYEKHDEHLAQGLAQEHEDYQWLIKYEPTLSFQEAIALYLVRLFDYSEVGIRKLALQAMYGLIEKDNLLPSRILDFCRDTSDNTKEHVL